MDELRAWLTGIDASFDGQLPSASGDASFRQYFRARFGDESFIVMDAPPPQEDCRPFVKVARYLEVMQLNAPRVLHADLERGFLLLTDLGNHQYLDALTSNPDSADELYEYAIAALLQMQSKGVQHQAMLPPYDVALLSRELALFHDWLCGTHLGLEFGVDDEMQWRDLCALLIGNSLQQPAVFVHRDYHSRNLMVVEQDNPGILDFQDAVEGPLTYDLVSLLKDCYVQWPLERVHRWALDFFERTPDSFRGDMLAEQFLRFFDFTGVQRHLKAAGIFARLNHRDGKPRYMDDIPRTLSYITGIADRYPELGFLDELITERVLPGLGVQT